MIGNDCTLDNGLYISIDWIAFTVKKIMALDTLVELFGLDMTDFQTGLNGTWGYKSRIRHFQYPISILYDGADGMGIHVEVTGSAVGYFLESYRTHRTDCPTPFGDYAYPVESFSNTVLSDMLQDIFDIGSITRLDIAIDDLGCNYYSMDELTNIFDNGLYVSRFKKWRLNLEKGKFAKSGHSIYFGSRTSEIMFRIYDKQLERNAKKDNQPVTTPWIRWEMELHKNRAIAVALFLISGDDISSVAIGVLSNYLRLIEHDNTRDTRCSNSSKWDAFICGIQRIRLCQPIPEKTLEEKKEWIVSQVAPTLSAIYKIDGSLDFFYDVIEKGSLRYSKELIHILQKEGGML